MDYDFLLCGVPLRISVPRPLPIKNDALLFRAPVHTPLVTVTGREGEVLAPSGVRVADKRDSALFRDGPTLHRALTAGERFPAVLSYHPADPHRAELTVEKRDWNWALDDLRLWSTLSLSQLLLPHRVLLFHASCVDVGGKAVLFTAPSGTGKSTQAELWRRHRGARVINGDKAGVSLDPAPTAHGVPFSGTSGICANVSLPLSAIVCLSQNMENTISHLSPSLAAAFLCENLFADQSVSEEWTAALNLVLDLVAAVPVFHLSCTPDEGAVATLEAALSQL